jgi:hypothetical protein
MTAQTGDAERMEPALNQPFQFSQSCLSDFDRCRRLFKLGWIDRLDWPAGSASLLDEQMMVAGQRFHRLMHQHFVGIDVERALSAEPEESALRTWWNAFREFGPPDLPAGALYPELTLYAPLVGHQLMAKVDLLAVDPGRRLVVVDWKTGQSGLDPARLRQSWQSCVYQYVAVEAGAAYAGGTVTPEMVKMMYWSTEYPASPVCLGYSAGEHAGARERLTEKIEEIASLPASAFVPCDDEWTCTHCRFRGYCLRGSAESLSLLSDDVADDGWDWSDASDLDL